MKNLMRLLSTLLILMYMTTSSYAAYETVSCGSDESFSTNSCDQCFNGGAVVAGDSKGLLTDVWENNSDATQVLFKEEQEMPRIVSLGGASWTEVEDDDVAFWTYTSELDALYDEDTLGYTLDAGNSVTWIQSTLPSAYQLVSSSVPEGENVGMILYDTATHALDADGIPVTESDTHRECVLFTSGSPDAPVIPDTPRLPDTGAEHILLLFIAGILGFGFLKFRKK